MDKELKGLRWQTYKDMGTGTFDKDEFRFEFKRDEEAAKEIEEIQKIRDSWDEWYQKRVALGLNSYNKELKDFADMECERQIEELKRKK